MQSLHTYKSVVMDCELFKEYTNCEQYYWRILHDSWGMENKNEKWGTKRINN